MVTPQKSYLPLGSLKGALLYPDPRCGFPTTGCRPRSSGSDLGALDLALEEVARWDQVLSNGERQRLASPAC